MTIYTIISIAKQQCLSIIKENQLTELPMTGFGRIKMDTGRLGLVCQVTLTHEKTGKVEINKNYTLPSFIVPVGTYTAQLENERNRQK